MLFIISCPHLFNHLLKMKASEQYFHVVLFHLQRNGILNLKLWLNTNISMHILYTVLYTFPKKLTKRICLAVKSFFIGDHFLYSCDPNVFRGDIVMRNQMLVTLRDEKVKTNAFECIHILHTALFSFPVVLTRRICLTIKRFF